ncbi:MAG: ABC transporter permease [Chloroflexota bacterium]|jgi:peptide/nickel transport system permease protein
MVANTITSTAVQEVPFRKGASRSFWSRARYSLKRSPLSACALGFLVLLVFAAITAPVISPCDPLVQDLMNGREAPNWWPDSSGTGGFLGTDALGRDVLSRIIHGSRISLLVGVSAVLASCVVGVTLGAIAGFYGGWIDNVIMRIGDVLLSLPYLMLAIAIIAVLGPSLLNLILVLSVSNWIVYARLVRGEVLSVKRQEYIEAARAIGVVDSSLLLKHIMPNAFSPVLVISSFSMAQMILAEASLSFLGLGVQPPTPTWGGMLSEAREYFQLAPWITIFPGLAIMFTVLAVNTVGDWLRDVLDPRLQS